MHKRLSAETLNPAHAKATSLGYKTRRHRLMSELTQNRCESHVARSYASTVHSIRLRVVLAVFRFELDEGAHAAGFGQQFCLLCVGGSSSMLRANLLQLNTAFSPSSQFALSFHSSHESVSLKGVVYWRAEGR